VTSPLLGCALRGALRELLGANYRGLQLKFYGRLAANIHGTKQPRSNISISILSLALSVRQNKFGWIMSTRAACAIYELFCRLSDVLREYIAFLALRLFVSDELYYRRAAALFMAPTGFTCRDLV
jgi:hypothetical protein